MCRCRRCRKDGRHGRRARIEAGRHVGGRRRRHGGKVALVGGQGVGEAAPVAQLLLELPASGGAGLLQLLQGDAVGGELGGDRSAQVLVVVVDAQLGASRGS